MAYSNKITSPTIRIKSKPSYLVLFTLFLLMNLVIFNQAHAAVCHATENSSGSGQSWADSINLQSALVNSNCTEIWLKSGTYYPGTLRTDSFYIDRNLSLLGGFSGTEISAEQRNPKANLTVLSGDIGVPIDATDNSYHVLFLDAFSNVNLGSTVIDGLTITGGNANGANDPFNQGGGLYCLADGLGRECSPVLSRLRFINNRSGRAGGAIFNDAGVGRINSTFKEILFMDNTAIFGGAMSGFVRNDGSMAVSMENITFLNNSANYGGAIYQYNQQGLVNNILENITFAGNSASSGGALFIENFGGSTLIQYNHLTMSNNSADFGSAFYNFVTPGTNGINQSKLNHVILWSNPSNNSESIFNDGTTTDIQYSVIEGGCPTGSDCENIIITDPLLKPLADNGGDTLTFLLAAGSSAIDSGDLVTCAPQDQRGLMRPSDGDLDGQAECDIGAVEVDGNAIFMNGFE